MNKGYIMQHFSTYWFLPLGFLVIGIIFYYLNNKKWPPYIEKNSNSSCYIVNVVTFIKYGHCSYMGYAFTKNKNGKYKIKHNIFDLKKLAKSGGDHYSLHKIYIFPRFLLSFNIFTSVLK